MKARISAHATGALLFLSLAHSAPLAHAGGSSPCDGIARDVTAAVTKDPGKVLMIVEDALVINETCACEVVKAAIVASKADKSTVQQIVQTALAVAPKMSAVIAECAEAAAPGTGVELAAEQTTKGDAKNAANVLPPPAEPPTEASDFGEASATNIRGVYLIQPAAAGFVVANTGDDDGDDHTDGGKKTGKNQDDDTNDDDDAPVNRANSRRTRNLVALSPAKAVP